MKKLRKKVQNIINIELKKLMSFSIASAGVIQKRAEQSND
jgi:hypothetical protein